MADKKFSNLLRARFPFIYINTYEEDRATKFVQETAISPKEVKIPREVFVWTQSIGLKNLKDGNVISNTTAPNKLVEFIEKYDSNAVFILYDFHVFFGTKQKCPDCGVIRSLRDLVPVLKMGSAGSSTI